jgi:hypothetical protein
MMSLDVKRSSVIPGWYNITSGGGCLVAQFRAEFVHMNGCSLTGPELSQINDWFRLYLMGEPLPNQEEG